MDAFVRALAALLPVIWRSASSPSLLRPTSSAGLSPTHLLALVGELWIFFPPFTQWQHGEVLWGLGANELTLQCWGRCSVTQGESEDGAGGDAPAQAESEGPLCARGLEGLNRTSQMEPRASKVGHSAKLNSSFKMTSQNGILDSISSPSVHSVSADFNKLLPPYRKKRLFIGSVTAPVAPWDRP